jgi:hypothetical protein
MTLSEEQTRHFDGLDDRTLAKGLITEDGTVQAEVAFYLTRHRPTVLKKALQRQDISDWNLAIIQLIVQSET